MASILPHTTRADGLILTGSVYNADHQNHITNANSLNAELVTASANIATLQGDSRLKFPAAGGTANALTLTPAIPLGSYVDMDIISFEAIATNTGAATLAVSGLAAKALRRMYADVDTPLAGAEIINGGRYWAQYDAAADGGAGAWILINGSNPEFSFTPAMTFGGAAVGMTFSSQTGTVHRISDKVWYMQFNMVWTAKGTSTGSAVMTGFPMTLSNGIIQVKNYGGMVGLGTGGIVMDIASGTATVNVRTNADTAVPALTHANFSNTSSWSGGGIVMSTLVV